MSKRVLEGNRELLFRISLARSTMQIDSNPDQAVVKQFAEHLLAEVEQTTFVLEKKNVKGQAIAEPKVKKLGEKRGWRRNRGKAMRKRSALVGSS